MNLYPSRVFSLRTECCLSRIPADFMCARLWNPP